MKRELEKPAGNNMDHDEHTEKDSKDPVKPQPCSGIHPFFKQRQDQKYEQAEPCHFSAHHRRFISREDAMNE